MTKRNRKWEKCSKELEYLMRSNGDSGIPDSSSDAHSGTWSSKPGIAAIQINEEYKIRSFNRAASALLGRELERGLSVFQFIPEGEARFFQDGFRRALEGESVERERVVDIPGGSKHWFMMDFNPLLDGKGRVEGASLVFSDLTGEKREKAHLDVGQEETSGFNVEMVKQNSFLRSLLDAIPVPLFFKDRGFTFLGCNRAFTLMMGLSWEEIEGKKPREIWPEWFPPETEKKELDLLEKGESQAARECEISLKHGDGRPRKVMYSWNVFYDGYGRPAGIAGAFTEIGDGRKAGDARLKFDGLAGGLPGCIPICAGCKNIQDLESQGNPWVEPSEYIGRRLPNIKFSHGMCPECMKRWYPEILK